MPKSISQDGINLIKEFEDCKLIAYRSPAGVWTIGYGHTSDVTQGMRITQAQADAYLRQDLTQFESYVNDPSYVPFTASLTQGQFDALVSFAYNCGAGKLKQLCSGSNATDVGNSLPLYNKNGGKVLQELANRRAAEQALYNKKEKKSVDELAKEVWQGKWGNGEDRKQRLTAAGYDYAAVQRRVNEIDPNRGAGGGSGGAKSVDELAKEVWQGKWGNGEDRKRRLTAAGYDYAAVQRRVNQMA